ncbi:Oidioi.mRNA.OKI2018_I69.PAR.g12498.t1.cds [Oikopleura dioica]|uniref:Essential MCU regulator, mitochondrial n=1 Tax=Oikopleura dioica TaxID=34765 RepID=A0ABN7S3T3_OIKDI|nr:Oidioi.mRNA.OKI2018_I69.PAR.g12498.t1.cds [Oikopleura dioica]
MLRQVLACPRHAMRRALVTDSAGAYLEIPHVTKWAVPKFAAVFICGISTGAFISARGAKFLEEYELFVPDDDDDDDDD